jgi:hypothetical protein
MGPSGEGVPSGEISGAMIAPHVIWFEQQGSVELQGCPVGMHGGATPSSGPASEPPQHACEFSPQLSMQLPLQPFGMQHVCCAVHSPDEHPPHWIGPPHPSEMVTLHELPQLFVGVQQLVW